MQTGTGRRSGVQQRVGGQGELPCAEERGLQRIEEPGTDDGYRLDDGVQRPAAGKILATDDGHNSSNKDHVS